MKLKSIACLLASVVLCVSLVGCGGQSQDQTGSQQVETVSIDATPIQVERSGFSVSLCRHFTLPWRMTGSLKISRWIKLCCGSF